MLISNQLNSRLDFNPIIVLFLTLCFLLVFIFCHCDFNPIIVLFLTVNLDFLLDSLKDYFNPIIVLFLTQDFQIFRIFRKISILL